MTGGTLFSVNLLLFLVWMDDAIVLGEMKALLRRFQRAFNVVISTGGLTIFCELSEI
jgi:hypothetical protein